LGVDLKRFRPSADRADHPAVRLISVGRLSTEKRPDIAIGALAELLRRGIRAELTLMGSGPLEARLRRQAAGLPVQFTGFLSGEAAVAAQLAATDIALATGPAETFGLAALEGLACGIPTVTVEGAATAELVRGQPEAGRSATLDASAFADAVTELLDVAPADRRNAARDVAQRYPWSATVDRMRDLHRSVTHRTGDVAL
jgi:alpha-1,6-mannosyltransferase